MREEEAQENTKVAFQAYGIPLESVTKFNYLGRVFTASHDNWPAVVPNIWKSWSIWARFTGFWDGRGVYPCTSGTFYKAEVQVTLLLLG